MVRIGLIGIGSIGRNHARVLYELGVLTCVCDIDEKKVVDLSEKYGVAGYTSVDKMISAEKLDGVVIATPTSTHVEFAEKALKKGLHVLVEKPLTLTYGEGARLPEKAREAGVVLGVGYVERFNPVVGVLGRVVRESGHPILLEFSRENIRPERIKDVGVVFDTMVHDIDLARYMFASNPISVYARIRGDGPEEMAAALLEFSDGLASLVASWRSTEKCRKLRATFKDRVIELDFIGREAVEIKKGERSHIPVEDEEPLKREDRCFVEAIEGKSRFPVDVNDGLWVTKLAEAVLLSGKTGIPIYLSR